MTLKNEVHLLKFVKKMKEKSSDLKRSVSVNLQKIDTKYFEKTQNMNKNLVIIL